MKGMKGKFMKKLKTVKQIGYIKPDRILQVSAFDGFVDNFQLKTSLVDTLNLKSAMVDHFPFKLKNKSSSSQPKSQQNQSEKKEIEEPPEIIDVNDLMKDLDDKENETPVRNSKNMPLNELDMSDFRKPDMGNGTLFDPNLLAAFEQAVTDHAKTIKESKPKCQNQTHMCYNYEIEADPVSELENETDPLAGFEEKCPPGGDNSVVFYTTSLRGIRKTFEDCQSIRFLLESFRVAYYERDVSVHAEFRDELWKIMGERVLPPRLFVKGRYIGGAEQVLALHEQGRLRLLFCEVPIDYREGPCNGCCGLRFALCLNCNGSRKVFDIDKDGGNGGVWSRCHECNENGLIVCPFCS